MSEPLHAKSDDVTLLPGVDAESGAALDALMLEQTDPAAAEAAKVAAEAAAAAAAAKTGDEDSDPIVPPIIEVDEAAKAAAEKEAADKLVADAAAAAAPVKDAFDDIALPPHSKPASTQAFEKLKTTAREQIAAAAKLAEETKAQLATAQAELEKAKAVPALAPEVETELEDLRKFKLASEVESDPQFQKFDGEIKRNTDKIFTKLKEGGYTPEQIAKMQEIGVNELDWEPIVARLSLASRRFIEATLVANVNLTEQRSEALTAAQTNASAYMTEKQTREAASLTEAANGYLKNLPWTAEQQVPANATAQQKADIETANAFARESVTKLKGFLSDRSPARFAELAVGTIIAYRQKSELERVNAKLDTLTKTSDENLKKITAERDKLAKDLADIKKAELPRGGGRGTSIPPAQKLGVGDMRKTEDALDALAAEVVAGQA